MSKTNSNNNKNYVYIVECCTEELPTKEDALSREAAIKKLTPVKKRQLISEGKEK